MSVTRKLVATFIINDLSGQFHLPPTYFKEKDNLRKAWLFDDRSLVALGKDINRAEWNSVYVTPLEMVDCKTIADVINLVWSKTSKKS